MVPLATAWLGRTNAPRPLLSVEHRAVDVPEGDQVAERRTRLGSNRISGWRQRTPAPVDELPTMMSMEGLVGDGYRVLGVTIDGPPPLGRMHVNLRSGLSVLYGLNGAGKTRVLNALASALQGYRSKDGQGVVHVQLDDASVVRSTGFTAALLAGLREGVLSEEVTFDPGQRATGWLESGDSARAVVEQRLSRVDSTWEHFELAASEAAWAGYFSLEAVGTTNGRWQIWVSNTLVEDSPLADAYRTVGPLVNEAESLFERHRSALKAGDNAEAFTTGFAAIEAQVMAASPWDLGHQALLDLATDYLAERPHWVPVEIATAGSMTVGPVDVVRVDEDGADVDGRTRGQLMPRPRLSRLRPTLFDGNADSMTLDEEVAERLSSLEKEATRSFRSVVGAGPTLRFDLGTPERWFLGDPPAWVCDDEYGAAVPLAQLSKFRRRWATAAIELALAGHGVVDRPSIVLSDEPEAGVHRTGEVQVVSGLVDLMAGPPRAGVVATHSPAFLQSTSARLLHVRRDVSGKTHVSTLDGFPEVADLGLTRADLLALRRVFVIVEGEHDKIVLETLFRSELERAFAQIFVLRGAKQAIAAAHAEWLLTATDAPLLIVLDKLSEAAVAETWASARAFLAENRSDDAGRAVRSLRDIRKDEAGFLGSLGEAAIRTGALPRLHFWGLSADDILLYLPDGERLVKDKKGQKLANAEVRAIVGSLDGLHPDLTDLIDEIDRLSQTFGAGTRRM